MAHAAIRVRLAAHAHGALPRFLARYRRCTGIQRTLAEARAQRPEAHTTDAGVFRDQGVAGCEPALQSLKAGGIRMAFLANLTPEMLDAGVRNSGLDNLFEPHLSTDRVQAFKPDPRAYQMAVDAFGLRREEIAFAAFGGWDAAGAKAFGYATYWVNRANAPPEELSLPPDATGSDLRGLESFCRYK